MPNIFDVPNVGHRRLSPSYIAILATLLSGCATVSSIPPASPDWNQVKQHRQALAQWQMNGRAAVSTGDDGWSAGLKWIQSGAISELKLQGALGIGGVQVRTDGAALDIQTSKGQSLSGEEAKVMLEQDLGLTLPLRPMRFWLLGVPEPDAPALAQLDEDGRLGQLNQAGWSIAFDRYRNTNGSWLPGRIRLEQGGVKVRVVIDRWEL